jgi:flagellar hook assembly protein FlgD
MNWIFTIYNKNNKVVETLRIMNRTDSEANKEAESYMENVSPYNNGKYSFTIVHSEKTEEFLILKEL